MSYHKKSIVIQVLVTFLNADKIDSVKLRQLIELYRYLNFNQIERFEDEGRVIAVEDMPKIEDILGMPAGALK